MRLLLPIIWQEGKFWLFATASLGLSLISGYLEPLGFAWVIYALLKMGARERVNAKN